MTPLSRGAFDLDPELVYLNHAAAGILPRVTHQAIDAFVDAHAHRGVLGTVPYQMQIDEQRTRIGALIGASGDEIAILRHAGEGATAIAQGIDWKPGDEIVLSDNEFGSNAYPWLALREKGVVIRFVETARERLTPDVLRRAIGARTRLVAVSWVSFGDGYRHDLQALGEIAHAHRAFFAVDAMQGLGAFPLDVRTFPCDALYAGAGKWLMALQGVAFLYLRAGLLDTIKLRAPSWRSVVDMWDFLDYEQPFVGNVSRFEAGTPNYVGALSLATSVDFLRAHDIGAIGAHVVELTDRLVDGLRRGGG